jgi:hypothetical protein
MPANYYEYSLQQSVDVAQPPAGSALKAILSYCVPKFGYFFYHLRSKIYAIMGKIEHKKPLSLSYTPVSKND